METNLFHKSSSSPPQPQNALGKPLILRNCSTVSPLTPPKNSVYGRLKKKENNYRHESRPGRFTVVMWLSAQPKRKHVSVQQIIFWFVAAYKTCSLRTHSHVHVFVQSGGKVAWHLTTAIVIPVILWNMVNIMEDQAVPVQVLHGLQESHVKQHGSVEGLAPALNTHIQWDGEPGAAGRHNKNLLAASDRTCSMT